jgi:hypothetical protein
VRHIFGVDSILNQPNSVAGILFYCILIGLSKYKDRHEVEIVMRQPWLISLPLGVVLTFYYKTQVCIFDASRGRKKTESKRAKELVSAFNICKINSP